MNLVSSDRVDEVRGLAERQCFDVAICESNCEIAVGSYGRQVDCLLHDPDLAVADQSVMSFLRYVYQD